MLKNEFKLYSDFIIQYIKFENNFLEQLIQELAAIKLYVYIPKRHHIRIVEILKYLSLLGLSGLIWFLKNLFSKFLIMFLVLRSYVLIVDILNIFPMRKDLESRYNLFENVAILLAIIQTCRKCSGLSDEDIKLVSRLIVAAYTNQTAQIMIIILAISWILFRKQIKNYFNNEIILKVKGKCDSVCLNFFKEIYASLLHASLEILIFFLILLILLKKVFDIYDFLY